MSNSDITSHEIIIIIIIITIIIIIIRVQCYYNDNLCPSFLVDSYLSFNHVLESGGDAHSKDDDGDK